jgi:hypothetical protein
MQVDADEGGEEESDEWEYSDTEELITLDLGPESKRLLQMSHQYSITGLETDTVFFRLGNVMFKGRWDQLIGTEILLRDTKDASRTTSLQQQHEVSPLPATRADIKTGRAPGTTRRRIQFLPAVNMVAREDALKEQSGVSGHQPLITHRGGWVWMRGKGWIRKDQVSLYENEKEDEEVVEEEEGTPKAPAPRKKLGRKKMTPEERMRYSIYKSLQKVEKSRQGQEQAGDDSEEDDDAASGSESEEGSPALGNGVS